MEIQVNSLSIVQMARLEMLQLHFKFSSASLSDLNWSTEIRSTSKQGSDAPSITSKALSSGRLANFLYSGNLISNKELAWSVEYEFYCRMETGLYCSVRENEI